VKGVRTLVLSAKLGIGIKELVDELRRCVEPFKEGEKNELLKVKLKDYVELFDLKRDLVNN